MTESEAAADTSEERPPENRGWLHWLIVLTVFSITGSMAVWLSRLILHDLLGLEGSFWGGPWTYTLTYLALIPPCYSTMLAIVGTLFGKGPYFRKRVVKMWSRLLPQRLRQRLLARVQ